MKKLKFDEHLPLDKIDIGFSNVRKTNPKEGIDDLKKSIEKIGLQQPIMVFQKPDRRFDLIIGQRRYLACKELELKDIPALITSVKNETEATVKSFSENIHRLELEYRDKMEVATRLVNKLGSVTEVAKYLGVAPSTVKDYLGYNAVPEPIKKMVDENRLSATTALNISKKIPDEKQAVKIAERIREIPRSEDRTRIIDIAHENPGKSMQRVVKIAQARKQMKTLTIHVTQRVYEAILLASKRFESDKEDVVKQALEEWLKKRGFIE